MRQRLLLFVSLLFLSVLGGMRAAESALPSLEGVEPGFKFVVLGDNRTGGPDIYEVTDIYKRIIEEVNLLRPSFVVLTGDIIYGYTGDETVIRQMWSRWLEATAVLEAPLFKVIGNHDVWGELSQRIYQEIFSEPLYYSFDFGGCHFVVLDSELQGEVGKITGEQFKWLENDLSRNRDATYTFVFLHRPLWRKARGDPEGWAPVHQLLVQKGVDAVFAGHDHMYAAEETDGIRYIVSGGAGAPLAGGGEATGAFFHYCLVSVEPGRFTIAVIKPGSVEGEKVVTAGEVSLIDEILDEWIGEPVVDLYAQGERKPVRMRIENRSPIAGGGEVKWELGGSGWRVAPESMSGSLPAGESVTLEFSATPPEGALYPAPRAVVSLPLALGRRLTAEKPLVFRQRVALGRPVATTPVLDGTIDPEEWKAGAALKHFPLNHGRSLASQRTTAYLCWDEEKLYLGIICEESHLEAIRAEGEGRDDPDLWKDDCVEVFLDTNYDGTSYYHFIINSKGAITDWFHSEPSLAGDAGWNADAKVATAMGKEQWSVEMAIPFAALGTSPRLGEMWGFNLGRERQPEPQEFSIFSCTYGGFNTPKRFADLVFGG